MQQLYDLLPQTIPLFGGYGLSMYWLLIGMGLFAAAGIIQLETRRTLAGTPFENRMSHVIPRAVFWAALAGFAGTKLFYLIFYGDQWEWNHLFRFFFSSSGSMYYGAEIGVLTGGILYLYLVRFPILKVLDGAGLGILLAHGIARWGCFTAGCCGGISTSSSLGVVFNSGGNTVFPTQLFEAIPSLVAFVIFWFTRKRFTTPGRLFAMYLLFYGALRLTIEFFRASAYPIGPLQLSASQHIAIIQFLLGGALFYWLPKYHHQTSGAIEEKITDYSG